MKCYKCGNILCYIDAKLTTASEHCAILYIGCRICGQFHQLDYNAKPYVHTEG